MTDHQTARRLAALDQVLILTHRRPDGDTIGCASALCLALRQLGKTAWVLPNEDAHGLFTPYLEGVLAPAGFLPQHVVAVDVASLGMLPDSAGAYKDRIDLVIDHHGSNEGYGRETCVDPSCAACGELLYRIFLHPGNCHAPVYGHCHRHRLFRLLQHHPGDPSDRRRPHGGGL